MWKLIDVDLSIGYFFDRKKNMDMKFRSRFMLYKEYDPK